jgi:hypothetical protein
MGLGVERVHLPVPGSEVDGPVDDERRRLGHAGPEAPELLTGLGIHRDEKPRFVLLVLVAGPRIHDRLVDDPVGDGGRSGDAAVELLHPDDLAGLAVDRQEPSLDRRDEEALVGDDGWELDQRPASRNPELAKRRAVVEGCVATASVVVAERRPGELAQLLRGSCRRAGRFAGLELGRR